MRAGHVRHHAEGTIFVVLTLIGWSSAPLFLKYLVPYVDAWTANGWRYAVAAALWAPLLITLHLRGALPGRLWRAAIAPSVFNVAGQVAYALAPYYIDPGLMAFLLRFQMVFVTAGAYFLFPDERPVIRSAPFWIGLVIVFLGSAGTIFGGHEVPRGGTALGITLAVVSGALFGGYGLAVRRNMAGVRSSVAFAVISQVSALMLLVLMLCVSPQRGGDPFHLDWTPFLMLIVSALIGIALAHVFFYAAIARLGVAISGGVILLMPFATALASYFLFDERLTAAQWISGTAAVIGAALILAARAHLAAGEVPRLKSGKLDDGLSPPPPDPEPRL